MASESALACQSSSHNEERYQFSFEVYALPRRTLSLMNPGDLTNCSQQYRLPALPRKRPFVALAFLLSEISLYGMGPVSIALLPPANMSKHSALDHWRSGIPLLVERQLQCVHSIRVIPASSISFVTEALGLTNGCALTRDQARQVGEAVEARWIVWGTYDTNAEKVTVDLQLMSAANGKSSRLVALTSTNWCEILSNTCRRILDRLNIRPPSSEQVWIDRPLTKSPDALALLSLASFQIKNGTRIPSIVIDLRRTIALDPECQMAHEILAFLLMLQNDSDEAMTVAKRALALAPESASAHSVLGTVYLSLGLWNSAKEEFFESIRLYPYSLGAHIRLGEVYIHQSQWNDAFEILRQSEALAPYDALIHGYLG